MANKYAAESKARKKRIEEQADVLLTALTVKPKRRDKGLRGRQFDGTEPSAFKPGQSGNPGGVPKRKLEAQRLLREATTEMMSPLLRRMVPIEVQRKLNCEPMTWGEAICTGILRAGFCLKNSEVNLDLLKFAILCDEGKLPGETPPPDNGFRATTTIEGGRDLLQEMLDRHKLPMPRNPIDLAGDKP